jgi:propionyl-CoA carboxylase alpha chain
MSAPPPADPDLVAAAAVAVIDAQAAARTTLPGAPFGWRNVPSQLHELRLGDHTVRYGVDRWGAISELLVDGVPADVQTARDIARLRPPLVIDGVVHLLGGRLALDIPSRFSPPDDAGRAGSLVAPMPGSVLRVLVAVGDTVVPGQPMLAMEAMKMEHQVVAPTGGTVAEIFVQAGQQLDHGQVLVRIEAADAATDGAG